LTFVVRQKKITFHSLVMNWAKGNLGWIEVICGPMFSGKSEELIRRLRRAEIARQRVQIFKPGVDQRYADDHIVSHSDLKIRSVPLRDAADFEAKLDPRAEVIGIDEAQFLGMGLVDSVVRLADLGKRIIVAGLDTDYLGRPFHPIPELLAVADEITKTLAICMQCGNPAKHTQRLVPSEDLIVVGAAGMYEARCRRCFEPYLSKPEEDESPARTPVASRK
jgi:thymidine kinase